MPTAAEELADLRQRLAAKVAEWRAEAYRLNPAEYCSGRDEEGSEWFQRFADEIEQEFVVPTAAASEPTLAILTPAKSGSDAGWRSTAKCIVGELAAVAEPVFAYGERGERGE